MLGCAAALSITIMPMHGHPGPALGRHTCTSPERRTTWRRLQRRTRNGLMMDRRGRGWALYWDRALSWCEHCRRVNDQHCAHCCRLRNS